MYKESNEALFSSLVGINLFKNEKIPLQDYHFNLDNVPEFKNAVNRNDLFPGIYLNSETSEFFFAYLETEDCPIKYFVSPNSEGTVPKEFIKSHFLVRPIWMSAKNSVLQNSFLNAFLHKLYISVPFKEKNILCVKKSLDKFTYKITVNFRNLKESGKLSDENKIIEDWNNIGCKISLQVHENQGIFVDRVTVEKVNIMVYDYGM